MNAEITNVELKIGVRTLSFTMEELRQLHRVLNDMFRSESVPNIPVMPGYDQPRPYLYPVDPTFCEPVPGTVWHSVTKELPMERGIKTC